MIRFLTFTLLFVAAISVPYILLSEKEAVDTDLPTHRIDRRDIVISVTEQGTLETPIIPKLSVVLEVITPLRL